MLFVYYLSMKYTDETKLEILKNALGDYGLSFDDYEVDYFFNRKRYANPILEEYDENGKQEYSYSSHLSPKKKTLLPSDFENSTYGTDDTLLDWYLYRNWNERTLVWENVGKEKFDIKKSFLEDRNKYSQSICYDLRGNIFNRGDGNHRLVLLMINHFLERSSALNEEEKQKVDEKYAMTLDIEIPIKRELSYHLMRKFDEMKEICPRDVMSYRERSYSNYDDYLRYVEYNEENETYSLILNGVKFVGKADECIEFLKNNKKMQQPIMTWQADGVYYISCENRVWKSKNKEEMVPLYHKIKQAYKENQINREDFLEIKNVENNTYEISYSGIWLEDKQQGLEIGSLFEELFLKANKELLFSKLEDSEYWKYNLTEKIAKCHDFFGGVNIPELKHTNLTKEEFLKLKEMYSTLTQAINQIKHKEQEV